MIALQPQSQHTPSYLHVATFLDSAVGQRSGPKHCISVRILPAHGLGPENQNVGALFYVVWCHIVLYHTIIHNVKTDHTVVFRAAYGTGAAVSMNQLSLRLISPSWSGMLGRSTVWLAAGILAMVKTLAIHIYIYTAK